MLSLREELGRMPVFTRIGHGGSCTAKEEDFLLLLLPIILYTRKRRRRTDERYCGRIALFEVSRCAHLYTPLPPKVLKSTQVP